MLKRAVAMTAAAGLGCFAYGALVETRAFRLRRYDLPLLPPEADPIRILHLEDSDRDAVDAVIEQLIPLLEKDDIVIDGGNSYYLTTERRDKYLAEKGLRFIGSGVSGGEEGARFGPSLMPGGDRSAGQRTGRPAAAIA